MIASVTAFFSSACFFSPFHSGACCVERTTASTFFGSRPSYSIVTWLFASGRIPEMTPLRRTSACRSTRRCERLIGSGMSRSVSPHAKPNIMPWSPAPCAFFDLRTTPRAMSADCSCRRLITPQPLPSKPIAASS